MPKSTQRCRTNLSSSSKEPSSRSRLMRSRAVSLPALCSRSRRSGPPPASASADWRRSSSMRSRCFSCALAVAFFSGKLSSGGGWFIFAEDTNGEMRGEPNSAEQQDNSENKFGNNGDSALERRRNRRDVVGGFHEDEHRGQRHRNDEHRGEH